MSCKELQEEELEVLRSIYEGDENFKEINTSSFQYKYGEDSTYKSFMVEIRWGDTYPEEAPTVTLDLFYNKNILDSVKQKIVDGVLQQTEDFLDTAMTYTLFEWVKENYDELVAEQPDSPVIAKTEKDADSSEKIEDPSKKKERKEQLTKHQKKRIYDKFGNARGERHRGWDWVDVVKHLSQTGGQNS